MRGLICAAHIRNFWGEHQPRNAKTSPERLASLSAEAEEIRDLGRHEIPRNRAFCQAKTTFSLTGAFAPVLATFRGGLSDQTEGEAMSFARSLPNHLRPRRAKLFTDGKQTPIDRNDRARAMLLAEAARRKGEITRAAVDIFRALLFKFANLADGRCFPSYERIAEAAGCKPRTVGRCLPRLESAGLITWVNRIRRVRERVEGLCGIWASVWRVIRTSNAYDFPSIAKQTLAFVDKGQSVLGTSNQDTLSLNSLPSPIKEPLNPDLLAALESYQASFQARQERK
jgi:hypothetical protein